jgi:hypothetical protein
MATNEDGVCTPSSTKLRIARIITNDFPKYFVLVSRVRHETHAVSEQGGVISSTIVPKAQAVFPEKALQKKIKLSLQAMPIPYELISKMFGNRVTVSPIITIEPRRRKFHKAITLTIPLPKSPLKGMMNNYSHNNDSFSLRLLCSITGGLSPAQWEDITGHTPLSYVDECVSFTTTVSARFWLMDCQNVNDATRMATELYREAIAVPFMCRFVVYAKRYDVNEAKVRVYCITDDREEKSLETRENFITVAKSKEVEVLENKIQWLEIGGNIAPVISKSIGSDTSSQLNFNFQAFYENRLPFVVRIKDIDGQVPPSGRLLFLKDARNAIAKSDVRVPPVCTLDIQLPAYNRDAIEYEDKLKKFSFERGVKLAYINENGSMSSLAQHREFDDQQQQQHVVIGSGVEFNIRLLSNDLNNAEKPFDWINLAQRLELTNDEIEHIRHSSSSAANSLVASPANQTNDMLEYWINKQARAREIILTADNSNELQQIPPSGETLLKSLRDLDIDDDIIQRNMVIYGNTIQLSNGGSLHQSSLQSYQTTAATTAENIYSVEKSLAKLNLTNLQNYNTNTDQNVETSTVVASTILPLDDRDIVKESDSIEISDHASSTNIESATWQTLMEGDKNNGKLFFFY